MNQDGLQKWLAILFLLLLLNTAYVAAFPSATVFYMGNVLLHLVLGVALGMAALFVSRARKRLVAGAPAAVFFFALALIAGAALAWKGNVYANRWMLWAHIVAAALGVIALVPFIVRHTNAGLRTGFAAAVTFQSTGLGGRSESDS